MTGPATPPGPGRPGRRFRDHAYDAGGDPTLLAAKAGFRDLEAAIAAEAGLVGDDTVVVTTVHELQVLPAGAIPVLRHLADRGPRVRG